MNRETWLINNLKKNRFLRYGFLLTAIHVSAGALGYAYQVIIGRLLEPDDFALFSSIMALTVFASAPLSAMSMLIVAKVSSLKGRDLLTQVGPLFLKVTRILITLGSVILVIFFMSRSHLMHYLKIDRNMVVNLFGLTLLFSLFHVSILAFLQGLQSFLWMGLLGLTSVVGKTMISVGLIHLGLGVEGALLGVLISMVLVYLVAMATLFNGLPRHRSHVPFRLELTSLIRALPVVTATTAFAAMTQLDVAIVNWYFSSREAGLYAAASVLGKAVLYLPGGLILALFPIVAENHTRGSDSLDIFRQAVTFTILTCGLISCLYWLFGDMIIRLLYGEKYNGAGQILKWYGLTILPLAIVFVAEHYLIARGRTLFVWLFLVILPIELLLIYMWHSEIWMIQAIMAATGGLMACVGSILMWKSGKYR